MLAGLWAPWRDEEVEVDVDGDVKNSGRGEVKRPLGKKGVFVVPQRAYMVAGTLLDQ